MAADWRLAFATSTKASGHSSMLFKGVQTAWLRIPFFPLNSGSYWVKGIVLDESALHPFHEYTTRAFEVVSNHPEFGLVSTAHEWQLPS